MKVFEVILGKYIILNYSCSKFINYNNTERKENLRTKSSSQKKMTFVRFICYAAN